MTKIISSHLKIIGIASGIGVAIIGIVFASRFRALKHKIVKTSLVSGVAPSRQAVRVVFSQLVN